MMNITMHKHIQEIKNKQNKQSKKKKRKQKKKKNKNIAKKIRLQLRELY
jgi:hypothetical protein